MTLTAAPRHARYAPAQFFAADAARGAARTAHGQRALLVGVDWLREWLTETTTTYGTTAPTRQYRAGEAWGTADLAAYRPRVSAEYGRPFAELGMGLMLETWWWPFAACGWGRARFDFRHARLGLIRASLTGSAVVSAGGPASRPACHLYAGLFAAAFSGLTGKPLVGVEAACVAAGAPACEFLIASATKAESAGRWRDDGASVDAILARLTEGQP